MKKAAMFGLDARIALAIFGALSVISGAALYSAIKSAQSTSVIVELEEVGKAVDAFRLDTGVDLPMVGARDTRSENLLSNVSSIAGWNGPYLSGEMATASHIKHNRYSYFGVLKLNEDWGSYNYATSPWEDLDCVSSCYYFVTLGDGDVPYADYTNIDTIVDGSISQGTGKVRYKQNSAGEGYLLYQVSRVF